MAKGYLAMTIATRQGMLTVLMAAAGAALVAAALVLPRWTTAAQRTLDGILVHDFGIVEVVGRERTIQHEFALVNRMSQNLNIRRIISTCGCLDARANREVVAPGETIVINASMRLFDSGVKAVQINIVLEETAEPVILHMHATALQREAVYSLQNVLQLSSVQAVELTLYVVSRDGGTPPPVPQFTAAPGISAEFADWTIVHKDLVAGNPVVRWQGTAHVRWTGDPAMNDVRTLNVRVGDMAPLDIRCEFTATSL